MATPAKRSRPKLMLDSSSPAARSKASSLTIRISNAQTSHRRFAYASWLAEERQIDVANA